jgi:hypothetical protein
MQTGGNIDTPTRRTGESELFKYTLSRINLRALSLDVIMRRVYIDALSRAKKMHK